MGRAGLLRHAFAVAAACAAPTGALWAAEDADLLELKRAIEALREENRALSRRIETLEAERAARGTGAAGVPAPAPPPATAGAPPRDKLEERVRDLETAQTANEAATRNIIQQTFSSIGPRINETLSLGGQLEMIGSTTKDFSGAKSTSIQLSSANLEFDIHAVDWTSGVLRLDYQQGLDVVFPTTTGGTASVDRINLDQAYFTIGDVQRFPVFTTMGRLVLPFGVSTGRPITDTLSVNNPLTVEVFEIKQNAVGLGVAFPTPPLTPAPPPVIAPPVQPAVVAPAVGWLARSLGYVPVPVRPKPLTPLAYVAPPPPIDAAVYFYDGDIAGARRQQVDATVGFNARGTCGRRLDELPSLVLCPWGINVDVNYNSSVYNSQFLRQGYEAFIRELGATPAMAASIKAVLGPFSLVGEWNGATKRRTFVDDANRLVSIKPWAWQVSLGYQLNWNPWVTEIGAQGTFVSVAYSESDDLAGATALVNNVPTRVGFVPNKRLLLTFGEWVNEAVRLQLEYAYNWDYPISRGGTGNAAPGFFASLVYAF